MEQVKKKLLCIEDDRETAALLEEVLVERGFAVSLAYNGYEGMETLFREQPDLVLCDINMPIMSGFEVLERLTEIAPRFADMPFIFLTALAGRDDELKGRKLGADDYVTKPIDFEILITIINARLARVADTEQGQAAVNLTDREVDALTWSARGKTSDEIAQIIGLTKTVVDAHLNQARVKLRATTRTEAVVNAVKGKLIKP
ncbi:MAG TPA: response regulator [Burkholderiaceae bacterium]|jgi:DNA-binding response OmpR family regulator|nr:response regulator [Burkholderiaceae bacterium]